MRFGIVRGPALKGVAHFVDEAQEFAARFSGITKQVTWTESGEMITLDGRPTGWKLVTL